MKDITLCHPRLQVLAARLIAECGRQGLSIKIGETMRTVEEQDALYALGRSKPGDIVTNAPGSSYSSYHQWGTAFDIYRNDGQGAYNEAGGFFNRVGAVGISLGLEWGGKWTNFVDKPHFQLPDWGSSTSGIKKLYKNPAEFKNTWKEVQNGWTQESDGWRFYLGNSGNYVVQDWYKDGEVWYWFNQYGIMIHDDWVFYKDKWYYLKSDGAMAHDEWVIWKKELYRTTGDGSMFHGDIHLETDEKGALK